MSALGPTLPMPLARASRRVVTGFGQAMRSYSRVLSPRDLDEWRAAFAGAHELGWKVGLRGTGNSYGDASLSTRELLLDNAGMDRILAWDPERGEVEVEPGATIRDLWRRALPDGWWPAVVPGTMKPSLGGVVAMNVHGKNCYKVGPTGDHVLDLDLLTPTGELLRCSREENADLFHAVVGGFGMLGAITRLRLRLKRVESGFLRVEGIRTRNLEEAFAVFEERCPDPDYLVGWLDGTARGRGFGRGVLHAAHYLPAAEDPLPREKSLSLEAQELPKSILGVPKSLAWIGLKPFVNNFGMPWMNAAKYHASKLHRRGKTYRQSHVAFAFLLDYVPDWIKAYGREGLIQYQPFVPRDAAPATFERLIRLCQERRLPPYLLVLKRHRPDPFLLTHAVDGYSLAMDLRVTRANRAELWRLGHEMSEIVLEAGGRFYFAKDALLRPDHVRRAWGEERLERFCALRRRVDPEGLLQTDLSRRIGLCAGGGA